MTLRFHESSAQTYDKQITTKVDLTQSITDEYLLMFKNIRINNDCPSHLVALIFRRLWAADNWVTEVIIRVNQRLQMQTGNGRIPFPLPTTSTLLHWKMSGETIY